MIATDNPAIYGVRFSAHGLGYKAPAAKCNLTLSEAEQQAREWEARASTVGGIGEIVTAADADRTHL
jgi:hypothetical protein